MIKQLFAVQRMLTILSQKLAPFYAEIDYYSDLVDKAEDIYHQAQMDPESTSHIVNECWDVYVLAVDELRREEDRIRSNPKFIELNSQYQRNYEDEEDLLLKLGSIIAPQPLDPEQ